VEISKQEVGFDIEQLELASRMVLSEATDQGQVGGEDGGKESSTSSDSETSTDDSDDGDDDDSDSSCTSSDSVVTYKSSALTDRDTPDCVGVFTASNVGKTHPPLTASDSTLVIENSSAAAAEPAELVCDQLSSLTVSHEQPVTAVVPDLPQSDTDPDQ